MAVWGDEAKSTTAQLRLELIRLERSRVAHAQQLGAAPVQQGMMGIRDRGRIEYRTLMDLGREALPILDKVEQAADVVWTLRQNADRWPAEEGQQEWGPWLWRLPLRVVRSCLFTGVVDVGTMLERPLFLPSARDSYMILMATSKMSLQPSIIAGQAISFLGMFAAYVSLYGEKDLAARSKAFKELQDGEAAANGLECAEAPASLA